jgi:hypothetical protein
MLDGCVEKVFAFKPGTRKHEKQRFCYLGFGCRFCRPENTQKQFSADLWMVCNELDHTMRKASGILPFRRAQARGPGMKHNTLHAASGEASCICSS